MEAPKDLQPDRDAAVIAVAGLNPSAQPASDTAPWYERVRERFNALTVNQKILFGAAVLFLVVAIVVALASSRPGNQYKVLFSNVSDGDGAAIVTSLQQMNVPYRFTEGGGAIMVPADAVHETRLKLAGQGLPKSGNVGFELLENQKFGTSQFVERVNYQRALEGELARSISSIGAIKTARVHLAIPKQTAFVREQERATAAVVLNLHPGRVLDPAQSAAISRLVSSAVPGMQVQDVSIVDTEGGMLAPNPSRLAGLDASQLKYTAELEAAFGRRLAALLEPLAGKDGFRAQVTVDMDFNERERTSETYGRNSPPNEQSIRSQQTVEAGGSRARTGGIPGSLTNQPPVPPEAPIVNNVQKGTPNNVAQANGANGPNGAGPDTPRDLRAPGPVETGVNPQEDNSFRNERTVNYEVDRAIERLKSSKGQIRRVSAAIVLDHKPQGAVPASTLQPASARKVPYTPEELTQINSLVRDAIGYVQARGDTVSVVNLPFSVEAPLETPLWTPELTEQLVRYGAIALAVLFAYFAILRPLMQPPKPLPPPPPPPPPPPEPIIEPPPPPPPEPSMAERMRKELAEREEAWALQQEIREATERQQAKEDQAEADRQRAREEQLVRRYGELMAYVNQYVQEQPDATALLLRAWVAEPGANKGKS